jgi:IS5 family transposase
MSNVIVLPFQESLRPALPTILGNVDYRVLRDQLQCIDELLISSGLETQLLEKDLTRWLSQQKRVSGQAQRNHLTHSRRALRCNLARILVKGAYRGFAARLADSPLLQHFCRIGEVDCVRVPAKSTLNRYEKWWPEAEVREAVYTLLSLGASSPAKLELPQAVDLAVGLLDSTCLSVNIHFPVDWVLMRDATCTLMNSVQLIRNQGLKQRMEEPSVFVSRINKLCIQMTHAWNRKDQEQSNRERKKTFRQMDRLVGTVRTHAQRYRDLLQAKWNDTEWTEAQAKQVLDRMDQVLTQLPQAREQARQRILQGKQVANEKKILSLYEPDVNVIVRNKAGAPVEFGNTLLLCENPQGLFMDWELFRESAPADAKLVPGCKERMRAAFGAVIKALAGDRGFDSELNRVSLEEEQIFNAICPRNPQQLKKRNGSWKFKKLQRRRAQTEGRIAILTNVFLGGQIRSKGFDNRKLTLTWTVLLHNLWVLARMKLDHKEQARKKAA